MNLQERIQAGLNGDYSGLKNGFHRLNNYIFGLQKGTYYLLGGQSGTFKTTLVDFMLFNAIEDARAKGIPLHVFYYSYEIDHLTKQCNWLSVVIYQKYGVVVSPEKIKGLGDFRLTPDEQKMVNDCIPDVDAMFAKITFEFTPTNPTGIYHQLWTHHASRGKFKTEPYTDIDGNKKEKIIGYTPNDPKEITISVLDHMYFLKKERGFQTKETIDKFSEYCVQLRNLFGHTSINIQQFNSALSSVERVKFKGADLSPQQSDFRDSTNPFADADVVLGTLNPFKLDIDNILGYDVDSLNGGMLMLKVIKNRLSADNVAIAIFANPKAGSFTELPKPEEIIYANYK